MLHHFRHLPGAPEWFRWFALHGHVGVDIFFVLSGWLIGGQLLRQWKRTGRVAVLRFWARRWLRTLPAYYAMMLVFLGTHDAARPLVLAVVTFVQNYTAPLAWYVTWSLCIEEHFYLMLPLVVTLLVRFGGPWRAWKTAVVVIPIALSPLLRLAAFDAMAATDYRGFLTSFYPPTHLRLDGLFIGVGLAALQVWRTPLWHAITRRPNRIGFLGVLIVVGCTWNPHWVGLTPAPEERMGMYNAVWQFLLVSIGTALLIGAGVARYERGRRDDLPGSAWLADHAYTLYLTHLLARDCVMRFLPDDGRGFAVALIAAFALSITFAVALRTLVEKPGLRWRDRLLSPAVPAAEPSRSTTVGPPAATGATASS